MQVTLLLCLVKNKNRVLLRAQGLQRQYSIVKEARDKGNGRYHCQLGGAGSLYIFT